MDLNIAVLELSLGVVGVFVVRVRHQELLQLFWGNGVQRELTFDKGCGREGKDFGLLRAVGRPERDRGWVQDLRVFFFFLRALLHCILFCHQVSAEIIALVRSFNGSMC